MEHKRMEHSKMEERKKERHGREDIRDNRKVKGDHQEGIGRVIQRKGDMPVGQGGKMHADPREKANWRRSDSAMTPRRA